MQTPSLLRGTVVTLSTMRRLAARNPFVGSGSIASRNSGASVVSVVNTQIVTDPVCAK